MTKTIFCFLLLISLGVNSQELKKPETKKKNTISIEFYQPIQNSIREFYNDDWVLNTYPTEKNNYSRSSFSNAFGISYERIKDNTVFRVRLGITIRDIKEHQDFETLNTTDNYSTDLNQSFKYNQNHIINYNLIKNYKNIIIDWVWSQLIWKLQTKELEELKKKVCRIK
jgi:hypothetical protein